jgi:hypothetical protein
LLFPLAKVVKEKLELERYGVDLIDLPIMTSNLNSRESPPAIPAEHGPHEDPDDGATESMVEGEPVAQPVRQPA